MPPQSHLGLNSRTIDELREALPDVAERTVAAITDDVPSYADALSGPMGETIRTAVQLALGGFISLAARSRGVEAQTPTAPAVDGAYQLGRGAQRGGRRHAGAVRGARLRLHRRAVGLQRGRAQRRARDHRSGAATTARADGGPAPRRVARGGRRG